MEGASSFRSLRDASGALGTLRDGTDGLLLGALGPFCPCLTKDNPQYPKYLQHKAFKFQHPNI